MKQVELMMPVHRRVVLTPEITSRIEDGDPYRASGNVICDQCGQPYYKHPALDEPFEFLNLICNGDIVKL